MMGKKPHYRWFSFKYYASVMNEKGFNEESIGNSVRCHYRRDRVHHPLLEGSAPAGEWL